MRVAAFFPSPVDRHQHFYSFFHRTQLLLVLMHRQSNTTRTLKEAPKSKSIPLRSTRYGAWTGQNHEEQLGGGLRPQKRLKRQSRTDEGAKVLKRKKSPRRGPRAGQDVTQTSDVIVTEAGRPVLTGPGIAADASPWGKQRWLHRRNSRSVEGLGGVLESVYYLFTSEITLPQADTVKWCRLCPVGRENPTMMMRLKKLTRGPLTAYHLNSKLRSWFQKPFCPYNKSVWH